MKKPLNEKNSFLLSKLLENYPPPDIYKTTKEGADIDILMYSGLAGFCLVAIVQMISLTQLTTALNVALFSFAIALPFLIMQIMNYAHIKTSYRTTVEPVHILLSSFIALISSFIGITSIFWHFSWIAGIIFLVCALTANIFHVRYISILSKMNFNSKS